jgi:hypothetical protein
MSNKLTRREAIRLGMLSGGAALTSRAGATVRDLAENRISSSRIENIQTDVLVIGAGPSGIPAAIAAAREGAKVILVEEDMVPGGAPVDMYVTMLCGGPRVGIYCEMIRELNRNYDISGKPEPDFDDGAGENHWYLPSSYIAVLMKMINTEENITFMGGVRPLKMMLSSQGSNNRNRITGALIARGTEKVQQINAEVTIDATGTGEIAAMADCQTMYGREARKDFNEKFAPEQSDDLVQRCTWMYISQRIRPDASLDPSKLENRGIVEDKIDHWVGNDPNTAQRNAGIYLHWGTGGHIQCKDTRDPVFIAQAQREALSVLKPDMQHLQKIGFGVHLAPKIGVRESRRVVGEHVLTVNDLKSGKYPEDTVAISDYNLDAWGTNMKKEDKILPRYGIPYRSLIPESAEGLLIAGKAISGTHLAASSYRVQPIVASVGQAAGIAAVLSSSLNTGVRDIPLKTLQNKLRRAGVLID